MKVVQGTLHTRNVEDKFMSRILMSTLIFANLIYIFHVIFYVTRIVWNHSNALTGTDPDSPFI